MTYVKFVMSKRFQATKAPTAAHEILGPILWATAANPIAKKGVRLTNRRMPKAKPPNQSGAAPPRASSSTNAYTNATCRRRSGTNANPATASSRIGLQLKSPWKLENRTSR